MKTPSMMASASGLMCCAFGLVPESKLSHSPKPHHGFVSKPCHPDGKTTALWAKKLSIVQGLSFCRTKLVFLVFEVFVIIETYIKS